MQPEQSKYQKTLAEFKKFIRSNCDEVNTQKEYNRYLNEIYSFTRLGAPFDMLEPAEVMKKMLTVDYDNGYSEYLNNQSYDEVFAGEYYEKSVIDQAKIDFIDLIQDDIDWTNNQINDLENDIKDLDDEEEILTLKEDIDDLKNDLKELEESQELVREISFD